MEATTNTVSARKKGPGRRRRNSPRMAARHPGKSRRVDARMRSRRRPSLYTASIARKLIFPRISFAWPLLFNLCHRSSCRYKLAHFSIVFVLVEDPVCRCSRPLANGAYQTKKVWFNLKTRQFPCVIIIINNPETSRSLQRACLVLVG